MSPTCPVLLRLVCCVFGFFELLLKTFVRSHFLIYIIYHIYIYTQCPRYRHSHWFSFTCSPSHFWQLWADFVPKHLQMQEISQAERLWQDLWHRRSINDGGRLWSYGCSDHSRDGLRDLPGWLERGSICMVFSGLVLSLCVCHIPLLMSDISMKFFEIPSHIFSYFLIRPDKTQFLVC